jgi:hypothetical protein
MINVIGIEEGIKTDPKSFFKYKFVREIYWADVCVWPDHRPDFMNG